MGWMRALYVMRMVSFYWPQEVPARDLRRSSLLRAQRWWRGPNRAGCPGGGWLPSSTGG